MITKTAVKRYLSQIEVSVESITITKSHITFVVAWLNLQITIPYATKPRQIIDSTLTKISNTQRSQVTDEA